MSFPSNLSFFFTPSEQLYLAGAIAIACLDVFVYMSQYYVFTGIDVSYMTYDQVTRESMAHIVNTMSSHLQNGNTEVFLSDRDLWELLSFVIDVSGNGNTISAELLTSLGLYTDSVLAYLEFLGYLIVL